LEPIAGFSFIVMLNALVILIALGVGGFLAFAPKDKPGA